MESFHICTVQLKCQSWRLFRVLRVNLKKSHRFLRVFFFFLLNYAKTISSFSVSQYFMYWYNYYQDLASFETLSATLPPPHPRSLLLLHLQHCLKHPQHDTQCHPTCHQHTPLALLGEKFGFRRWIPAESLMSEGVTSPGEVHLCYTLITGTVFLEFSVTILDQSYCHTKETSSAVQCSKFPPTFAALHCCLQTCSRMLTASE